MTHDLPFLAAIDLTGSTASEIAARVLRHPEAWRVAQRALTRLQRDGYATAYAPWLEDGRAHTTRLWFRTDAGEQALGECVA